MFGRFHETILRQFVYTSGTAPDVNTVGTVSEKQNGIRLNGGGARQPRLETFLGEYEKSRRLLNH